MYSRLIYAGRVDLVTAFLAVLCPFCIGTVLGCLAGYYGRFVDTVVMRLVDVVTAFPFLVLVLALVFVLGPGQRSIIIAITAVGWVSYARIIRGEILVQKRLEYVLAARAAGLSDARIIARHLLPNVITQAIIFSMSDIVLSHARDRHAQLPRCGHPAAHRRLGVDDRRRPVAAHDAVADRHVPGLRGRCSPASASPCSATAWPICWRPSELPRDDPLGARSARRDPEPARRRQGRRRRRPGRRARRRARPRRRVGLRQEHDAARHPRAAPRPRAHRRRRDRLRRRGALAELARAAARRQHRHGLPGADDGAQPRHAGRRADRGGSARAARTERRAARASARSSCCGWSASPTPSGATAPTRTSSRAACASAS